MSPLKNTEEIQHAVEQFKVSNEKCHDPNITRKTMVTGFYDY
jgi:hypothetical protein